MNKERYERYKKYYTRDYLMGPNSFVLMDELISKNEHVINGGRVLDLGCGHALTSIFLANETKADTVYGLDLWISPTDNMKRIKEHNLEDKIIPIYGDALNMPFAHEYFDAIVTADAYHYFGCADGVFDQKILPFVKKGGYILIAIPGLKTEPEGKDLELLKEWAEGDDWKTFQTAAWWKNHLSKNVASEIEISTWEADCYDKSWEDWFASGHEYALRDKEYLDKGVGKYMNFVMICIKRNT